MSCQTDLDNYYSKARRRKSLLTSYKFQLHPEFEGVPKPKSLLPRRFWVTPDTLVELCITVVNKNLVLPEAMKWTNNDVIKWISSIGFPQYRNTFFVNYITGRSLLWVDASALEAMNIRDFEHVKIITAAIRRLYDIELPLFKRSISLPPRLPITHYKWYRSMTGPKYENAKPSDLFRMMGLVREPPKNYNHWQLLEIWLQHIPQFQTERFGLLKKYVRVAEELRRICRSPPKKKKEEENVLEKLFCQQLYLHDLLPSIKEEDEFTSPCTKSPVPCDDRFEIMEEAKIIGKKCIIRDRIEADILLLDSSDLKPRKVCACKDSCDCGENILDSLLMPKELKVMNFSGETTNVMQCELCDMKICGGKIILRK